MNIPFLQARISGGTQLLAIIGDPVSQVKSPEFWNPRLAQAGADAVLLPLHVLSSGFEVAMPVLRNLGNLAGLVFTVPFKERAMAFADEILPTGRQAGAINAMRREADGRWVADMFDGWGLARALLRLGARLQGTRVLLLGAGGAGRAIASSLAQSGIAALGVFDVNAARAAALAAMLRQHFPELAATAIGAARAEDFDIIINATPVGMAPGDGMPLPLGRFPPHCVVFDIVPKPAITPLMAQAEAAGCKTGGGQMMIDAQADAILEFLGFSLQAA